MTKKRRDQFAPVKLWVLLRTCADTSKQQMCSKHHLEILVRDRRPAHCAHSDHVWSTEFRSSFLERHSHHHESDFDDHYDENITASLNSYRDINLVVLGERSLNKHNLGNHICGDDDDNNNNV